MNIVIATDQYYPTLGGIVVATDQLCRELSKKKHTVSLIAPSESLKTTKEKINPHFTIYKIGSFPLFRKKGIRLVLDERKVGKTIASIKPDIVHIVTPGFIGMGALNQAKKKNIPVVATNHIVAQNVSSFVHSMPFGIENLVQNVAMNRLKNFYGRVDHMISPSGAGAEHLKRLGVSVPITVVSNGLYIEHFSNVSQVIIKKVGTKFNLPQSPLILYVGRFDKEKQVDLLLEAFNELVQSVDACLLLVGTGVDEEILKSYVDKNKLMDKVRFAGFQSYDELSAIYHLADIFVMPSPVELQSLATMEAMSARLPVVGADSMALPYLIHNDENGYLFKTGDTLDLVDKLKKLILNTPLRKQMGEKSFEYVKEHEMNNVIKKFEKLYKEVINEKRSSH